MAEGENKIAKRRVPAWVKTIVPILVSAGILYYYLRALDWEGLWGAMNDAYVPLALIGLAGPQLLFWYLDTYGTWLALKWFHREIPLRKLYLIKGATYLLSIVSQPLQGGGVFVYMLRKADIGVSKLAGIMLFRFGMWAWIFNFYIAICTFASQYYGLGIEKHINLAIWWTLVILGALWLVEAWLFWHHGINLALSRLLVNKESEFWSSWTMADRGRWLKMGALSTPPFIASFLGFYAIAISFGIDVPFWKFMVLIPMVVGISFLPVAFGGYGTTTLAWEIFFSDYGTKSQLAAISLFIPTARLLIRVAIGLGCLPGALKDLTNSTKVG